VVWKPHREAKRTVDEMWRPGKGRPPIAAQRFPHFGDRRGRIAAAWSTARV